MIRTGVIGRGSEVVNDPSIDLVLVLPSMQQHGEIARAAVQAGKHVLVEEPMAMTLPEAAELVALASPSPTHQAIWNRLDQGAIGKGPTARDFYGWAGPGWSQWFYQPGSGAMFDLGVYNVTTLAGLLGPARRVMAMSGIAIPEQVVDDKLILVQTGDDRYAVITPEHAYHVLEIMLKSAESGRTGQALPIKSTLPPPRFDDASTLGPGAHLVHDPGVAV